jgi:hypothetical protein
MVGVAIASDQSNGKFDALLSVGAVFLGYSLPYFTASIGGFVNVVWSSALGLLPTIGSILALPDGVNVMLALASGPLWLAVLWLALLSVARYRLLLRWLLMVSLVVVAPMNWLLTTPLRSISVHQYFMM